MKQKVESNLRNKLGLGANEAIILVPEKKESESDVVSEYKQKAQMNNFGKR